MILMATGVLPASWFSRVPLLIHVRSVSGSKGYSGVVMVCFLVP